MPLAYRTLKTQHLVAQSLTWVRIVSRSWLVSPRVAPLPGRKNSSVYGSSSDAGPAAQQALRVATAVDSASSPAPGVSALDPQQNYAFSEANNSLSVHSWGHHKGT